MSACHHVFTLDTVAGIVRCVVCGSTEAWDDEDPRPVAEGEKP